MKARDGSFLRRTEPGGRGWAFARVAFDSPSAGLQMTPPPELAFLISEARLADPEAVAPGFQTPNVLSVRFRHPTGDLFLALGEVPRGGQARGSADRRDRLPHPVASRQLVARGGARAVRQCPRSRSRPQRSLTLGGAEISFGCGVTMYRFGARFDPAYRKKPVSIQGLVRIRFGSDADGQTTSDGHSKSM